MRLSTRIDRALVAAAAASLLAVVVSAAVAHADGPPRLADHVVIVTIDGPRASECLDGDGRANFTTLWGKLAPLGVSSTRFENDGTTKTCPGHASLLTGTRQRIGNDGSAPPTRPTIFERYRDATGAPRESCYFVASKGKIGALAASDAEGFGPRLGAAVDLPILPLRADDDTVRAALRILAERRPAIAVIALAEPDIYGHLGDHQRYVEALRKNDVHAGMIWRAIEADHALRGRTSLIVTSDHGRHLDPRGGIRGHGCDCEGCRRIPFFALGAGIRAGVTLERGRQVDIAPTVAELLRFPMPDVEGRPLAAILAPVAARAPRLFSQ